MFVKLVLAFKFLVLVCGALEWAGVLCLLPYWWWSYILLDHVIIPIAKIVHINPQNT